MTRCNYCGSEATNVCHGGVHYHDITYTCGRHGCIYCMPLPRWINRIPFKKEKIRKKEGGHYVFNAEVHINAKNINEAKEKLIENLILKFDKVFSKKSSPRCTKCKIRAKGKTKLVI